MPAMRIEDLRRWAALLDSAFRVPGTKMRFGLDPILGLIPGLGDMVSPVLALVILWHGARVKVPKVVLARMVINALIDAGVGTIPVVGDLFDFGWKSNQWNLALLEHHAQGNSQPSAGDWLFVSLCALVLFALALLPVLLVLWIGRQLI
jgi:Domain of unknown function (DUF4112)